MQEQIDGVGKRVAKKQDMKQLVEEDYTQRVEMIKKEPLPPFELILSVDKANALLFYEEFLDQVKSTNYPEESRL